MLHNILDYLDPKGSHWIIERTISGEFRWRSLSHYLTVTDYTIIDQFVSYTTLNHIFRGRQVKITKLYKKLYDNK